jgi:hypothetical protein
MVETSNRTIESVRIQNSENGAVYYFVATGGWQATNCSGVIYAFIAESAPGAKAILSAALTAKTTGASLTFKGICGDSGGNTQYLQIKYTIL